MTKNQVESLFCLAGIKVIKLYELANQYWPDVIEYYEIRKENPWWLVKTEFGEIVIGWRKRVISIDWSETAIREIITNDNVTKSEHLVHAYGYSKAVEYLSKLSSLARRLEGQKQ